MNRAPYRLFAKKSHWITALAVALSALGVSIGLGLQPGAGDLEARPLWPPRLSRAVAGDLVVTVSRYARHQTLEDLVPVSGAEVTLFQLDRQPGDHTPVAEHIARDAGLRTLATGRTDDSGQASLSLPPARVLSPASDLAAARAAGAVVFVRGGRHGAAVELVLHIVQGGEEIWQRHDYEPPPAAALALTTDRPLYQPGQTMRMRVLAVDPDTGVPVTGPDAVAWEMRDPRGNLVLQQETALGAAGVAHTDFALGPECIQGSYTIQARLGNAGVLRTVDVQPFRLPRFQVEVVPAAAHLVPGSALSGQVEAVYLYGEPVADAAVELAIQYTRADGSMGTGSAAATHMVEGRTDAGGRLAFSWQPPPDLAGTSLRLSAVVTSATGRAERGQAEVALADRDLRVDVLAAGTGDRWVTGRPNHGFVVVSDGTGAAVADAAIELVVPEAREERHLSLATDARGRATFSFVPTHAAAQARVHVTAPDGRTATRRLSLDTRSASGVIEVDTPQVDVGEPLGFTLRDMPSDVTIVAVNRSYPVGGTRVPRGPDGTARATITLDARARGLTVLSAYDARGSFLTGLPVWVVQRGGERVAMHLDQDTRAPGTEATLSLSFPASEGEGRAPAGMPPVTFGLVGVDEALYALAEHTEQPLGVLLRHDPALVQTASMALAMSMEGETDALDRRIQVARFVRDLRQHVGQDALAGHMGQDITRDVRRAWRQPYRQAWALVLGLGFLLLGLIGARATWRPLRRQDLSGGRVLALVGIIVAATTAAALIGAWSGEALAGALLVWTAVVVCWLVATAMGQPRLPLALWLWTVLGLILLSVDLSLVLADARSLADWAEWALIALVGAPAVLLLLELGLWALMLLARRLYKASFGPISFVGVLIAGTLVFATLGTSGRRYESADFAVMEKMTPAPSAMEMEADVAQTAEPPAPPPAGSAEARPRVRSFFPETMVWIPALAADAEGKAEARFPVPDSITTWRMDAWAHTWDGRLGHGRIGLRAWQPFFVELDLPTHLTRGDTVEVPVTLVNSGDAPVTVRVSVTARGGLRVVDRVPGRVPATVTVGPRARVLLAIETRAQEPGTGALTVSAAAAGGAANAAADASEDAPQDAVQREVAIAPHGRTLSVSRAGIIDQGWRATVAIPPDALAKTTAARVQVYPSVVADAVDGLAGMLRRPTGCFEQASSATYPNVLVLRALGDTGREAWPGGSEAWREANLKARVMLSLGYQKMLSYQRPDGGFALYRRSSESDILLSAYGLMQLAAMHEVLPIDPAVMRLVADFLAAQQNQSGSWPLYAARVAGGEWRGAQADPGQVRGTAFVAWALAASPVAAAHEDTIARALDHVIANVDAADAPDALAFAANALLAGDRGADAARVLDRLAALARRDRDLAYWPATGPTWMGGRDVYADIETTALATHALLVAEAHPELLGPALRYLAGQRASAGGWGTTQATVWTLRTMHALRARGDQAVDLTLAMDDQALVADAADGDTARAAAAAGRVHLLPGDLLMHTLRPGAAGAAGTGGAGDTAGAVSAGEHVFRVDTSGPTAAMVQATASFAVPWGSPRARVAGERLALRIQPARASVRRGEALWITAALDNLLADAHGAVIVELPVPPAAYVDREPLEALEQSGAIDRFEVLPTHVRLYLAGLEPEQTRTFRYLVRPLLRGQVSLPAARAYPFYVPEPVTEVDSGALRVE